MSTIAAQKIYDLRALTGFCSGTDLHDLFRKVLDGKPSPSGKVEISIEKLEAIPRGAEALAILRKPLLDVIEDIGTYILC